MKCTKDKCNFFEPHGVISSQLGTSGITSYLRSLHEMLETHFTFCKPAEDLAELHRESLRSLGYND